MKPNSSRALSVYTTKAFARFARKARISEADLWKAAESANDGLIDADLGGGVIKQRIARAGGGKSGGSRSIIVFRKNDLAVYVYGFEKKDLGNVPSKELEALQKLAKVILNYTAKDIERTIAAGEMSWVEPRKGNDDA